GNRILSCGKDKTTLLGERQQAPAFPVAFRSPVVSRAERDTEAHTAVVRSFGDRIPVLATFPAPVRTTGLITPTTGVRLSGEETASSVPDPPRDLPQFQTEEIF